MNEHTESLLSFVPKILMMHHAQNVVDDTLQILIKNNPRIRLE